MCTLTWWRDENSYGVFFNRDEKKDRPIAEPPRLLSEKGVRFLAPRDPQAGGTWMLVNEVGFVVCLLNKWHLEKRAQATQSRGLLVLKFGELRNIEEARELLQDLGSYPPFSLFLMNESGEWLWEWDGMRLSEVTPQMPMTSSSYRFEEVKRAREEKFSEGLRGEKYHAAKGEESSAYTVRMCRPDAQTWSRSRVSIGEGIVWEYLAERPNLDGEPLRSVVKLARC